MNYVSLGLGRAVLTRGTGVAVVVLLFFASAASAITVTTTSDSPGAGACSLRQAIAAATSGIGGSCGTVSGSPVPITLPAGHYNLTAGELQIAAGANLAIAGANQNDPGQTVIDAQLHSRVLEVAAGANATLTGVEITGGRTANGTDTTVAAQPGGSSDNGGGILNHGTLKLDHSVVTGNGTGRGGKGGDGAATNTAARNPGSGGDSGIGGGIYNDTAAGLTVQNSTISANFTGAGGAGGNAAMGVQGLGNIPGGADGGTGGYSGDAGGIYNGGGATITDTTVSGNFTGRGGNGGNGGAGAAESMNNNPAGKGGDGGPGVGGGVNYSTSGPFTFVQGGGGIYNDGSLTMSASTLSGNGLGAGGTGGSAGAGGLKLMNGYFDGGTGGYGGPGGLGAGLLEDQGTVQLTNVSIAGNATGAGGPGGAGPQAGPCCGGGPGGYGGYGGGIWDRAANSSSVALTQATISQNAVGAGGAGGAAGTAQDGHGNPSVGAPGPRGRGAGIDVIEYDPGSAGVTETNTIVAGNGSPGTDANCYESNGSDIHDGAHNIVYADASCPGTQANPKLGSLANNGGPTKTMLPGAGSSAINNVPLAACTVSTDQRGNPRPGHGKPSCDSGAVETGAGPSLTSTSTALRSSANPSTAGQQLTFTATVSPLPDGGTVSFRDNGVTISGCGSAAVSAGGQATCGVKFPSAGAHSIVALYSGDSRFAASTSPDLSQAVRAATSGNPKAAIGQITATGGSAKVPLTCIGPAHSSCSLKVILSATEIYDGRKLVAISASKGKTHKGKRHKKTVTLGKVTITLAAGATKNVTISLNRAGKTLLTKRHKLKVSLIVSQTVKGKVKTIVQKTVGLRAGRRTR